MMPPKERPAGKVLHLLSHAEERIARFYRDTMKKTSGPQMKSLIQAISDQKIEKAERIGRFIQAECVSGLPSALPLPELPGLERDQDNESALLDFISRSESSFRAAYALQADACEDKSEAAGFFASLARESKRHAAWALDRLNPEKPLKT